MRFTKLRLSGFKSFVEPIEIHIEPGLTGIVGPNGCGKSNLVEALRWGMGETSARQLRGGEMDDVIFNGAGARPPRNLAEVILSLDNADRSAPAPFDDMPEIDVSRRIERSAGSTYRINGREARARDVQTLFADAATGARSTALVSQGRIGAVIDAKPSERRHLLEEAAGISGLHARRHEAELRMRGAETNLERLDDVVAALDEQLRGIRKQARQANRYRNLSQHIRNAEAIVLHHRWREATDEHDAARRQLADAEAALADAARLAGAASTRQAESAALAPERRAVEAEAAAALRRLLAAREALDDEERRLAEARAALARRLAQNDEDTGRERSLRNDAAGALSRLEAEAAGLRAAQADEERELLEAARRLDAAATEVDALDDALAELTRRIAADEARRDEAKRRADELADRRDALRRRRVETDDALRALAARVDDAGALDRARTETTAARQGLDAARAAVEAAERERADAQAADAEARDALRQLEGRATNMRAETEALSRLLEVGDPERWPPVIDALTVEPGCEAALGAALGDDLIAATDDAAPVHWRAASAGGDDPPLPAGTRPMSDVVAAPDVLRRRLSQVGIVRSDAEGGVLAGSLAPGQRLVSMAGGLWRWDGFTVRAGAATAAAARLERRNRLAELRAALSALDPPLAKAAARARRTARAFEEASGRESRARDAARQADRSFQEARDAEATLVQDGADARSRLRVAGEATDRIAVELAEIEARIVSAGDECEAFAEVEERKAALEELKRKLAEGRRLLGERQRDNDLLVRESAARRERLAAIDADMASWRARSQESARQLDQLGERKRAMKDEYRRLESRPAEIAAQRAALFDRISAAENARREAADALVEAEARLEKAAAELRAQEAQMADRRELRVRRQAEVERIERDLLAVGERTRERLGCDPGEALRRAGLVEDAALPDRDKTEARLERLLRERENMGPVNLRAETEAAELDERISAMRSERDDLVEAIGRLRQAIARLNREGRGRLLTAFREVDRHFGALFARLFGGGRAQLSLTEAEDPFEAGLEVMASPPGKRLQAMSLLSGGEQALAALALLFAVFLTNPAPICVLDEVDAPLDDHNVDRFCRMLAEIGRDSSTRFLLVTHHRMTMARMDRLYGVTMAEQGVSQLVSVDLRTAESLRESA